MLCGFFSLAVTAVQPTKASSPSITSGPSSTTSVPTTTPGISKDEKIIYY